MAAVSARGLDEVMPIRSRFITAAVYVLLQSLFTALYMQQHIQEC